MWEVPDIYRNKKDKVVKPSDRFDKHKRDPKTLLVAPKRNIKPLPIGYRGADLVDSNSKGIYDDSGANTLIGDGLGNDSVFAISIDSFDQAFAKSPTDTYRKSHPKKGIIPSPLRKGSPGSKCSARSRSQSPSDVRSGNALQPGGKAYFDDVTSPVASPSNSKDEHDVDPKVNTEEMQNSLQSTLSDSAAAVGITPLVVSEDDASKALGAPMTDITVGTDHLQLPPSIAPQSAACSHNGSLTLDSHLEHAFDAKDHVSDVASDKGSFLGPVGNKRSGAGISQGMRAYSSKTVILAPTVGGPSMPTHSKLGGWKVNSVGRHSDHNRERISSAVCAKNMSRANSASAPQLRASTSPPKVKNSTVRTLKVDVGTAEDSRSGADSIPKTPPLVVNMLDVGLNSGDSPTAGDPGNQLHSYERTSCLSHASTDVDALQKEFVDHLSNSLVEAKDMPSYVVPKESADSVTDSPLSSCRDTSSDKKNHSTKRVVTIATSVTNLTGSGELEPYMVHSRIMGWKLTSLSRRKKLMTMLDKIQEIPTEDMIELSYSQSEGLIAPTEKSASTLNKSASTKECELNDTKTEVNDSLYANDYAASAVLNTYSRIWTDSETKVATLRASNSRSKSRREIEAWETSVTRQLKAFESTPLGRAEKIRRLTALARKPNGKGSADAMSVAREKEVTQKMLLKTRDENIEKVRKMHGPSELHLSLLRERDRMEILQAAKAITGDLTKRISSSSAYDGDSTIQQMLELRWQQQQASTSPSQVAGSIALGRQDENSAQSVNGGSLSVGMPARSQLYQALARPPPQSNILNSTFSSNFSSIPNSGDAEGFPLNDMELSPIGTGAGPRTGNVSAGVAMTDSNTVSSANIAPAFTDSFTDDVISKDTSDFFNGGENGRDFNSLATSNADMDGLNVPPLEVMEYRPDSNLQQNPENLLLSQRHDNWFRVVKSEPYLVASNSKMQKSLLSLPPV